MRSNADDTQRRINELLKIEMESLQEQVDLLCKHQNRLCVWLVAYMMMQVLLAGLTLWSGT